MRSGVHSVMRDHFRSCDKDGGHTIRSAITENPMLDSDCLALCFIEPKSLPLLKVYIVEMGILDLFCSCDLDLDPMTFINELDLYSVKI